MNNAINQPQTILVLGGNSDIARAIVRALASPALRTVILASRHPDDAPPLELSVDRPGDAPIDVPDSVNVVGLAFDATDHARHVQLIADIVAEHGDLDIVIQAFGQLGPTAATDPAAAATLVDVNFGGAVSSGLAVADQLRRQGHGVLVVLSSVAGVRTRPSNFVYGSTKAGQDAFATGLGHALHGSGARVLTVRPGFVRTSMTEGMPDAPFTTGPDEVAATVVTALRRGRSVVWAPGVLRGVFAILRVVPGALWRALDR